MSKPLLYLSSYIEAHRRDYYELLQRIRTDGDWNNWLMYFLTAVARNVAQCGATSDGVAGPTRAISRKANRQTPAMGLLDELFVNPYITVARATELLKVSDTTADKTVKHLAREGMLKETTGRSWGASGLAQPILSIIENTKPD